MNALAQPGGDRRSQLWTPNSDTTAESRIPRVSTVVHDRSPSRTWPRGDSITMTAANSIVVHGRSDSTPNRRGIRPGK
ncbi:MAG: hypothetical protein EOO27_38675 [Comamonadaceae bacterium]|nr:MAG: hypothetical protein EOO27_38675 [Comamonadaceae bacterium]